MIRFPAHFGARRLALAAVMAAALALPFGVLRAQDNPCPLGGYVDETVGPGCTYGVTMNVSYPDWLPESEAAQTAVGDLISTITSSFLSDIGTFMGEYFSGGYLDVSYEEYEHGAPLRSIVFTVETYTGGAHGNVNFSSITVDTLDNRTLALDGDIFLPDADAIAVLQPMVVAEIQAQQTAMGIEPDLGWISDGTDELTDYVAWAINAGSLELFFPPYQVAPYAMGSFQVTIPLDNLAGVVNPMLLP